MRHLVPALVLSLSSLHAATAGAGEPRTKPDAEGYIRDWLVMAPAFYTPRLPIGFEELDKRQLPAEAQLRPIPGTIVKVSGQDLTWQGHRSAQYFLDFLSYSKLDVHKALSYLGYAVAYVVADKPQKSVELRVGSNDMVKVFWNGKQVVRHNEPRTLAKDQNIVAVDLHAGLNVLVAKSVNTEQKWEIAARLTDAQGKRIEGVAVATSPKVAPGAADNAPLDAEGFIRDWVVLAPIDYQHRPFAEGQLDNKALPNEATLAPRAGDKVWITGQQLTFSPYHAKTTPFVDFTEHARGQRDQIAKVRWEENDTLFNAFSYAVAYVYAPRDLPHATVKIGANDLGRLWLNGKAIASIDTPGPLRKDSVSGHASLKKGANLLVLKVVNSGDAWQGSVRFLGEGDAPLTDLEIALEPPPATLSSR